MTLRDRIRELANGRGLSLPNLESKLGFGNGTIVKWDKASPNTDKLQKVADYFAVSVDYLLGRQEMSESDKAFFRVMKKAQEKGYDPDDIDLAMDFLDRARKRDEGN